MNSTGGTVLKIGIVMRPHGLRGAFTIKPLAPGPVPDFIDKIFLQLPGAKDPVPHDVEFWKRASSGHWIVHLKGFTIDMAEQVRNALVLVHEGQYGPLDPDEVWLEDLLDARVVWPDGTERGRVVGFLETPAPYPVLILCDPRGQETYLPLPDEHFLSFDEQERILVVSTPEH